MPWISTRGSAPPTTFRDALFTGLAPDGGLYMPARIDPMPAATIDRLARRSLGEGAPLVDVGVAIAGHLLGDEIPRAALEEIIARALDFPIPLVRLGPAPASAEASAGKKAGPHATALELFHGPTFAFKDVGARVMACLMAHFVNSEPGTRTRNGERGTSLTVLVATSGDTGSAVAQAFAGLPGTRVVVLFPDGQVSAVQEAQFTTLGGNVTAVAVNGTFDDCQAMVKAAFADADLRARVPLTSANSINVGRLLPQMFYYAWASLAIAAPEGAALQQAEPVGRRLRLQSPPEALQQAREAGRRLQSPPDAWPSFSVPSGNFGNLTAGLMAKRLGFPIGRFIAATNINDVVPEYLASGRYTPRASVRTVANAMDVGAPSNFERMRALYDNDLERLREDVGGAVFDDNAVRAAITEVYAREGYLLDPHSAIAWLGLRGEPGVFLATAHPAKFREIVEPLVGHPIDLPPALRDALARPRQVTPLPARYADLRDRIL